MTCSRHEIKTEDKSGRKLVDPTRLTALYSLDFGSVYTPDGREHPVNAFSLPFLGQLTMPPMSGQFTSSYPTDPPSSYPATGPQSSSQVPATFSSNINHTTGTDNGTGPGIDAGPIHIHLPANFGARLAVGVLAILLIAVIVWKML